MTMKTRQAREQISRELFEASHLDILTVTLGRLLAKVPDAQIIGISVIERYDDDEDDSRIWGVTPEEWAAEWEGMK